MILRCLLVVYTLALILKLHFLSERAAVCALRSALAPPFSRSTSRSSSSSSSVQGGPPHHDPRCSSWLGYCGQRPVTCISLRGTNRDDDDEESSDSRGSTSRSSDPSSTSDTERLLLNNNEIQQQMNQLRSKYPTSESAYLAAARARSMMKTASQERTANEQDWISISKEKKKQMGLDGDGNADLDGWEASQANILDSQILIPLPADEDSEGDGPKLLLF